MVSLHDRIVSTTNAGTNASSIIANLRSPGEHERRMNNKLANAQSIRRLRMAEEATKPAKVTPADQGVPAEYLNDDGKAFRIGMDARLKSDLVLSALGLITTAEPGNSLHVFTEKEAVALLEKRDWTSFLDRKREILAEKATKKAASDAKREEAARERAEAKKVKDAEKQQAKEAAAAEREAAKKENDTAAAAGAGKAQAQPDPKGGGGQQRPSRSSSKK